MIAASKAMREGARIAPERSCAEFIEAVTAVNARLDDPVDKLQYLRSSLNLHPESERALHHLPGPARRWFARVISAIALQRCVTAGALDRSTHLPNDALQMASRARNVAVVSVTVLSALLIALTLRVLAVLSQHPPAIDVAAANSDAPASMHTLVAAAPLPAPASVASSLPVETQAPIAAATADPEPIAAPTPQALTTKIWLVDKAEGWELYSNGLRVETAFEVKGEPRRFMVFEANQSEPVATETRPVGILMHTSESDLWPFEETFNANLRKSSRALLRYVRRLQLYNYVIDRFGRVYRVVSDDTRAQHAGRGVWSHEGRYYLSLNSAMLGICFETRWNGGDALPITQAQLLAGRNLTAYLRQRYEIAPDMVVAHGLTSVNAQSHLIGYHLDWARGFPFEAFGLPNQYDRQPPSVATFGFTYDANFLQAMGEPWPGVKQAEASLAKEARALGISVSELRGRKQALYDAWQRVQNRDGDPAQDNKDPHTAALAASTS